MSLLPAQLTALKNELLTDPKGYGYAATMTPGPTNTTTPILNLVRAGEQIPRTHLGSAEIFQAIVPSEWTTANMVTLKFNYLLIMMEVGSGSGRIDLSNGNVKNAMDLIFPSATAPLTNAAMHALYVRNGSRAETLFGDGTSLSDQDCSDAYNFG